MKLISTPWTDANLVPIEGHGAEKLWQEQEAAGVPNSLREVLHLAGRADTRFLIFDPDAPPLDGLTMIDN
ncbi:hypothetical protein NRY95_05675 [Xanthomonas campestris pv. phormiicola]|nr:hypothetical protein [Xanthomonas campestris pv. phormiicola]UYC17451.1 hypothetical protein NRY95_05675 [Xanthomonas campestris pv. phormiicola]